MLGLASSIMATFGVSLYRPGSSHLTSDLSHTYLSHSQSTFLLIQTTVRILSRTGRIWSTRMAMDDDHRRTHQFRLVHHHVVLPTRLPNQSSILDGRRKEEIRREGKEE